MNKTAPRGLLLCFKFSFKADVYINMYSFDDVYIKIYFNIYYSVKNVLKSNTWCCIQRGIIF